MHPPKRDYQVPKVHLTELCVRALKAPAKGQITYWDKSLPGFGLRVSKSHSVNVSYMVNRKA